MRELEGGPPSPTVNPEAGARNMAPPHVAEKEGVEPPKRRKSLRGAAEAEEEVETATEAEKEAGDEDEAVEELNKSKRVSGQGMERQKENRTPSKTKKFHAQRAVSTPQANKTVLAGGNLTCFGESQLDLSCITVLSPPSSVVSVEAGARSSRSRGDDTDATDAVSFRYGLRGMCREYVDTVSAGSGREARTSLRSCWTRARRQRAGRGRARRRRVSGGRARGRTRSWP